MFNKSNKKETFYIVTPNDNSQIFLTVTCTPKDAAEYVNKLLKVENTDHFNLWCELRNYDKNDENVWREYFVKCIPQEDKVKYLIRKITYKMKDLVAILRMFGACMPLGCSFDTKTEYNYLDYKLKTQEQADNLNKKLVEQMEQLKKMTESIQIKQEENKHGE